MTLAAGVKRLSPLRRYHHDNTEETAAQPAAKSVSAEILMGDLVQNRSGITADFNP